MHTTLERVLAKYPHESYFIEATQEFFSSLSFEVEPTILEQLLHAERIIMFRVPWIDRDGITQTNYGYRVQYNGALGPYKGGLRFDPSVNLDILKTLAFEQTFKNALTGIAMGGAKGGSDFNPKGKTDAEIMKFCQNFMIELHRHIGATIDVPAGDKGVGKREVGYMFGAYKRLTHSFEGVLTGKDIAFGGALGRTEATGYGLIYIVNALLRDIKQDLEGKRVVISGSGNVAIYAAEKAIAEGACVIAMSDRSGYVYDEAGLELQAIIDHKLKGEPLETFTGARFVHELPIWSVPCDIALPCATEGEINERDIKALAINGCKIIAEGANRPLTKEAVDAIQASDILYLPGKAANAGGVAVSGIEMSQNAQMRAFTFAEVDTQLKAIMESIYVQIRNTAKELGEPTNFLKGANHVAYAKVAYAMKAQGYV
ncbi:NADP-specific glutamate dehydrogenase [Erysipelothrix sp. HDW6C]|uniref:NADP-specific glutamate dehydrogenase n=1 Tax=Erysipelothrix sp. HDW6C TaxID=2714930 RepID=UPI001407A61F|nr:NADP-specific glutamate dehydrogenase [Erysipelothrix sp. HDW6C]QIK70137.1 NADP-specific glutamate dehydrogenase [Erysipelothrix sp. HDW6C]